MRCHSREGVNPARNLAPRNVKWNRKRAKFKLKSGYGERLVMYRFENHIEVRTIATATFIVPDDVNDAFNARSVT